MRGVSHRRHHVQRRRWLLWFPMMVLGLYLLSSQLMQWEPDYWVVALGIALCVPWVADLPDEC